MWSIDTRCAQCLNRPATGECTDQPELYKGLSPVVNKLNMEEPFASGVGNGVLIISCADFRSAPRD